MSKPCAVITGASRGIGRATALRLAADYDIVAVARSDEALESLAQEIEAAGGSCNPRTVDITNPAAVTAALSDLDAQVLVNNAGVGITKPFMELTRDEWMQMVNVNFNALFDVTRAVLPAMVRRQSGHVVFIGSIAGRSAFVGGTCYAATKHAVMGLTESLMLERFGCELETRRGGRRRGGRACARDAAECAGASGRGSHAHRAEKTVSRGDVRNRQTPGPLARSSVTSHP